MLRNIDVYQGLNKEDIERLSSNMADAYTSAAERLSMAVSNDDDEEAVTTITDYSLSNEVPPIPDLLGIDISVFQQINAALKSGKQHLMFYGPPGTGKTTLAQHCASALANRYTLITGSADWTSQDVVGGYQPVGNGRIEFIPGILLRSFDRPLIIDELNRCDIDKVIGPLFTVLSGQKTTLPFRVEVEKRDSEFYEIYPKPNPGAKTGVEFAPTSAWRIIATLNSIDKASLYQMSYALTRRFAWIYVDVPADLRDFLVQYLERKGMQGVDSQDLPLSRIWSAINAVRAIGPAPIIDTIEAMRAMDETLDLFAVPTEAQAAAYLNSFDMFLLPMLDGIFRDDAESIIGEMISALHLVAESALAQRLIRRLHSISI